jgi:hypothetical protein
VNVGHEDISGRHKIKLGASEMPLCQLQSSYIKFNNNNLSSLNGMALHKVTEFYT